MTEGPDHAPSLAIPFQSRVGRLEAVEQFVSPIGGVSTRRVGRHVADQFRTRWPKLDAFRDNREHDVLAYMGLPAQLRQRLNSTNTVERLNKEVKRRADVVGIFPNESAIIRLIGAVLLEANDEWVTRHRCMQVEAMAELLGPPLIEGEAAPADPADATPRAAWPWPPRPTRLFNHVDGRDRCAD